MKDYARFIVKSKAPVIRRHGRSDEPITPENVSEALPEAKPRPFDKKRKSTDRAANRTHGAYVRSEVTERKSPSLQQLQAKSRPHDVTAIPDSWPASDHFGDDPPASEKKVNSPASEAQTKQRPGPKRKLKHKRRRQAMSISVSEEEEFILRTYAAKRNMSFSEWSRTVMFRSMGRKIPHRS